MLKKKLATVPVVLAFTLLLAPVASPAAPLKLPRSGSLASVFDPLVQWWDLLAGRHTPTRRAADLSKNGCGIDPNGKPLPCPGEGPDPGTQAATPPDGGGAGS